MKVRILKSLAGLTESVAGDSGFRFSHEPGDIADVDPKTAADWFRRHMAEPVHPQPESASLNTPTERTTLPSAKAKSRKGER